MNRTRWLCLALGTTSAAIVVMPLLADGSRGHDPGTAVTIPDRLAGYSYLTGSVSEAPPGRAVALYQHGFGVEFMDFPQAVVLATDDDIYRRLDAAEARSGAESQGDPGPMLLSPDGRSVALGDHDASAPSLDIVDLGTGEVVRHMLPDARSVLPIAWSRDGSQVAYLSGDQPTNPHSTGRIMGDLLVLALDSGDADPVPGGEAAWTAAFSPDGRQIAVQRWAGRPGSIAVVDLPSSTVRALPHPGWLAGPDAWSPDGRLLAVTRPPGVWLVDVAGSRPTTPFRLALDQPQPQSVLGWTDDRELVILEQSDLDTSRLLAHAVEKGGSRELTRIDNTSSYGVARVQLASALLADLEVRVADEPERGPLPRPFRISLAILVGLAVTVWATWMARRHGR